MRTLIHHAFWLAQTQAWLQFRQSLKNPEKAQRRRLSEILLAACGTEAGRRLGFGSIRNPEDYQRQVPLCDYEALRPDIERMRRGEAGVLFPGKATLFEPSGGSAGGAKLIPYNAALAGEFQQGIGPWLFDLYRSRPRLRGGSAYWAISPATSDEGFESDAAYLGGALERLASRFMAVPPGLARIQGYDEFRARTMGHLKAAKDLRLISVWNPSFLTLLLEGEKEPRALWPELRLISCWADGHAASALPALQKLFPEVEIQPKGLLATEAFVTLPFEGAWPLSLNSHFFEFLDGAGRARFAWELESGAEYSVVVSTGGGLYRYRLKDRVRVEGFIEKTPSLRFLGKEDRISDCVGEKLEEAHVLAALSKASQESGFSPAFTLLAPEAVQGGWRYVLYAEGKPEPGFIKSLEANLCVNSCYAQARRLGQLSAPVMRETGPCPAERYLQWRMSRGQRLGTIKATALEASPEVHVLLN